MWIFSLRNNYELTVLLYCIRTGINNLLINQATQVYVITTNQLICQMICHGLYNICPQLFLILYINDLMYTAARPYTTLFTCQATLTFVSYR